MARKSESPSSSGEPSPSTRKGPERRGEPGGYDVVAIVGLGLIGGSLALALRRSGFRGRILGVSRGPSLEEGRRLGAIDEGFPYEDLPEAAAAADLIVLSSPISAIIEHLKALGACALRPGTTLTDVGSTKRAILQAAKEHLPPHALYIGGHPLAGSEQRGIAAADPFLFQNAYYVLTPLGGTPQAGIDRLAGFLGSTGARMVVLSAEDHDRIAAAISHLPQILAVSLVRFLDDLGPRREDGIRLAAGGFRDMTRIASSSYKVWKDIIATNKDMVAGAMERFIEHAGRDLGGLEDSALDAAFEKAAATRAEIPRDSKGFLHRLWDVLVVVEDRPGTIAEIAVPLARNKININDIEVLKVREGEAGTIRLAFETLEHAEEAIRLLAEIGYKARLRGE